MNTRPAWWMVLIAGLVATWATGAEPLSPMDTARAELKTVYGAARAAGDLWTVIQCEAYAATALNQRLGPALSGCDVVGDPLLAFPDTVTDIIDRGERVVVQTPHSCHLVAEDGRPLAVAVRCEDLIADVAGDSAHRFVAVLTRTEDGEAALSLRRWSDGTERWRCSLVSAQRVLAVAADGQAALSWHDEKLKVVVAGKVQPVPGRWSQGNAMVAAQGRWFIARRQRLAGNESVYTLMMGDSATELRTFAEDADGGAIVAMAVAHAKTLGVGGLQNRDDDETVVVRVDAQGKAVRVPVSMRLGRSPVVTVSEGMVMVGSDAQTPGVTTVDLLGNTVTTAPIPPVVAAFRCAEILTLKDGDVLTPCYTANGRIRRCPYRYGAWMLWSDRTITQLQVVRGDAGRPEIQTQTWPESPRPIYYLSGRYGRVLAHLADGMQMVCDDQGKILAQYAGDIALANSSWGVVSNGKDELARRWGLCRFAKPGQIIDVPAAAGCQQLDIDGLERFALGVRSTDMVALALPSGEAMTLPINYPLMYERDFPGRFVSVEGRIRAKTARWSGARGQWTLADGMPLSVGGPMVVLDRAGQVWTPLPPAQRRGGELWQTIAADMRYQGLAVALGRIALVESDQTVVARIDPRQSPLTVHQMVGSVMSDEPEGQTQDRQSQRFFTFRLANNQRMMWLAGRMGFVPRRLHLTPQGGLTVVTPSVILGLPASALPLVAGPDTRGR